MQPGGDDVPLPTLTAEGLEVQMDVSVIYHVAPNSAYLLYQNVGEDYGKVLIEPISRATVRDLVAQYRAEDLYATDKRISLQAQLKNRIESQLQGRGIETEAVLVRNIQLPALIKNAIESKLQAEQQAKQMEFVLDKERKEAERKVIEANGDAQRQLISANATATSQRVIATSLTDAYVRWYWVSTLKDQKSVYYVPVANDGLPIFKNTDVPAPQ